MIVEVEGELAARAREYAAGRREALAEALGGVTRPVVLRELLGALARDEGRFAQVRARSVRHPNGFDKIVLLVGAEFRLRLHVWDADAAPDAPQENVHNHRWDFAAEILTGGYRHQEYRPAADGAEFLGYRYRRAADGASYRMTPLGVRTLERVFEADLTRGSRYLMSHTLHHRVLPLPGRPTVSMVLEGPHLPTPVEVFTEPGTLLPRRSPLPALPADRLVDRLGAVAGLDPAR
ncbi:hypothetical protein [Kitasatospora sp. NPDC004272]